MDDTKKIVKFTYNDDGDKIYNPKLNLSLRQMVKKTSKLFRFKNDQRKEENTWDIQNY